ncbi:MAG TPA: UDP-N-acetylmuramoyl-L-alanine--D-glutamate ligase, partial [Eubacteriaceae bacterium]|nr:UDP-N-acetylmuramoyl-L-alanine--D-glutamate ligase [Eubacteriaceae bacterium]
YYDGRALQLLDEHNREPIIEKTDLKIPGPHNIQNVLAAVCLCYFYGISKETIAEGIRTFAGVEHRLEFVDKVKGVSFVNDSKATNVEAAITGLKAMDTPVVLIGGGYDKGADYSPWIEAFSGKVRKLILFGETAEDIYKTAVKYGYRDITICENLEQATRMGYEQAQKGETVLLSPACASWDQYESYEHRGRAFKKLVKELK